MKPDLRALGHQVLDETEGELTSLVILATYGEAKGTTMIAGWTNKIVSALAHAMKQNPEFRRNFEDAWASITEAEINLN